MKCMLMCNNPLPDFHVQWSDGTRLVYALQSSSLSIYKPGTVTTSDAQTSTSEARGKEESHEGSQSLRWEGQLSLEETPSVNRTSSNRLLPSIPQIFHSYLLESQDALQRCLHHEKQHNEQLKRSNAVPALMIGQNRIMDREIRGDYKALELPMVVVEDL
jgi:hypothetical protein